MYTASSGLSDSFTAQSYVGLESGWLWSNILRTIQPDPVHTAADYWGRLAAAASGMHDELRQLAEPLARAGLWTGLGQEQFKVASDKLLAFAAGVRDVAQFQSDLNMRSVSDGLAESMDSVLLKLNTLEPWRSYVNFGKAWDTQDMLRHNFDSDPFWQGEASSYKVPVTLVEPWYSISYEHWATPAELDALLKASAGTQTAAQQVLDKIKVDFLNRQQKDLFGSLATTISQDYARYYPHIPESPQWTPSNGVGIVDTRGTSALPSGGIDSLAFTSPSVDQGVLDTGLSAGPSALTTGDGASGGALSGGGGMPTSLSGLANPGLSTSGMSGLTTPGVSSPGVITPGVNVPGLGAPGVTVPGRGVPGVAVPGVMVPGVTVPGVAVSRPVGAFGGPSSATPGMMGLNGGIGASSGSPLASYAQTGVVRGGVGGGGGSGMMMPPPMYPPMGGMGGGQFSDQGSANLLTEDEEFWVEPTDCPPAVIESG